MLGRRARGRWSSLIAHNFFLCIMHVKKSDCGHAELNTPGRGRCSGERGWAGGGEVEQEEEKEGAKAFDFFFFFCLDGII